MSGMVMPLEVPLFYRIALAILFVFLFVFPYEGWLLFYFQGLWRIVLRLWRGVALNLKIAFYYVDPTYPRTWDIFPFSGIFFNFICMHMCTNMGMYTHTCHAYIHMHEKERHVLWYWQQPQTFSLKTKNVSCLCLCYLTMPPLPTPYLCLILKQ